MEAQRMNKPEGWRVPVHLESIPDSRDASRSRRRRRGADRGSPPPPGVRGVTRLHASVDLTRHGDGLRAAGRVTATVGQTCVVTLEPLENKVDEPFDVLFVPPEAVADAAAIAVPAAEAVDDTRETLVDGAADIGAVRRGILAARHRPLSAQAAERYLPRRSRTAPRTAHSLCSPSSNRRRRQGRKLRAETPRALHRHCRH